MPLLRLPKTKNSGNPAGRDEEELGRWTCWRSRKPDSPSGRGCGRGLQDGARLGTQLCHGTMGRLFPKFENFCSQNPGHIHSKKRHWCPPYPGTISDPAVGARRNKL